MATDALGMYSWAIEHGITRETHPDDSGWATSAGIPWTW